MKDPFKGEGHKMYYWSGIFYYKDVPCVEVQEIVEGNVVDRYSDRAGSFEVYDTGYITGKTITGNYNLKILY